MAAAPAAPANLTVTASQSHGITLSWDTDPNTAVSYIIYTATGPYGKFGMLGTSQWTQLALVAARWRPTTSYSYTDASGQDYVWYIVHAVTPGLESGNSDLGYVVTQHLVFNPVNHNTNYVSLPKRSVYKKASDVVAALGAGASGLPVNIVALWKPDVQSTQAFVYLPSFGQFMGSDFNIDPLSNPGGGVLVVVLGQCRLGDRGRRFQQPRFAAGHGKSGAAQHQLAQRPLWRAPRQRLGHRDRA